MEVTTVKTDLGTTRLTTDSNPYDRILDVLRARIRIRMRYPGRCFLVQLNLLSEAQYLSHVAFRLAYVGACPYVPVVLLASPRIAMIGTTMSTS